MKALSVLCAIVIICCVALLVVTGVLGGHRGEIRSLTVKEDGQTVLETKVIGNVLMILRKIEYTDANTGETVYMRLADSRRYETTITK
ncbi:hypothetical protein [Atlantibacter hermannii]|uniref:hypothetical protein n=1 Tax=Atlantibacter hermannii TaxID=565 RepID=UPI0028AFD70B|nr:hypothetical protein [Atlantibacter hermannii]